MENVAMSARQAFRRLRDGTHDSIQFSSQTSHNLGCFLAVVICIGIGIVALGLIIGAGQ
jgi:hypothetical protein